MKFKNTNTNAGFTIVELLIVIVVIGILAAITFVAFNGITARTNTNASLAAASSVTKKAEAFNAEKGNYPTQPSDLTGAAATDSWYIPTTQVSIGTAAITTKPADNKTVRFLKCAAATAASQAAINGTTVPVSGVMIQFWDHQRDAISNDAQSPKTGNTTSCPTNAS